MIVFFNKKMLKINLNYVNNSGDLFEIKMAAPSFEMECLQPHHNTVQNIL